jgi:hypothetical protein
MSKGMGTTQRAILAELEHAGRPCSAVELAAAMAETADPAPSVVVSVQRAIKTLAAKGLIETGRVTMNSTGRYRYRAAMVCWLPDSSAPKYLSTPVPGYLVEELIRDYVRRQSPGEAILIRDLQRGVRRQIQTELAHHYMIEERGHSAVRRALARLIETGEVRRQDVYDAYYRHKRPAVVSVYLMDTVSVKPTLIAAGNGTPDNLAATCGEEKAVGHE